jgi:hypothetical protein
MSIEKKIIEYAVIHSNTVDVFSAKVNRQLNDGWKLYGNLSVKDDHYLQPMVKFEEKVESKQIL